MEDSEIYMKLLKEIENNKYRLIQLIVDKGTALNKINPTVYNPFLARDFIIKVENQILEETENKEE